MPAVGKDSSLDDDARKGALKLRALLADPDPTAFEKWANETLEMSGLRNKRRVAKLKMKSAK